MGVKLIVFEHENKESRESNNHTKRLNWSSCKEAPYRNLDNESQPKNESSYTSCFQNCRLLSISAKPTDFQNLVGFEVPIRHIHSLMFQNINLYYERNCRGMSWYKKRMEFDLVQHEIRSAGSSEVGMGYKSDFKLGLIQQVFYVVLL